MDLESLKLRKFVINDRADVLMYAPCGKAVPTGICGYCGKVMPFVDKNRKEIAETINSHLRHYHQIILQNSVPPVSDLKAYTKDFLPDGVDKTSNWNRGIVLPPTDPLRDEVVALLERYGFLLRRRHISVTSWMVPEADSGRMGSTVEVACYHKPHQGWIPAPNTAEWSVLTGMDVLKEKDARERVQHAVSVAQEYFRDQHSPNIQTNGDARVHAERLSFPRDALREEATANMGPSSSSASVQGEMAFSTARKGVLYKVAQPGLWVRLTGSGESPKMYFSGPDETILGGVELDNWNLNPNLFEHEPLTKRAKVTSATCAQKAKQIRLSELLRSDDKDDVMTKEEEKRSAHLSRALSRKGRDKLLFLACLVMLQSIQNRVGAWSSIEKSRINAILFSARQHAAAMGIDQDNLQLSEGLNTSLDDGTLRDYASRLAKLIRMILEMKLYHYRLIETVIDTMPSEESVPGGDITSTLQFITLATAIVKTFYLIAVNPHLIMSMFARQLLFEEVCGQRDGADCVEDDEDGEDDEMDPGEGNRTCDGAAKIRMRQPASIRKYLSAWLYGLKGGVALEIQQLRMKLNVPMGSTGEMIVGTDRPFSSVLDKFKDPDVMNVKYVAKMIYCLTALSKEAD